MQEKITQPKKDEVPINWDGEPQGNDFERVLIPEDSYNFKVEAIEKRAAQKWGAKEGETETKLVVSLALSDLNAGDSNGKILYHYLSPKITKASTSKKSGKSYSNSKLYDLLTDLGLKEEAKNEEGIKTVDGLQLFLSEKLCQKIVRASVKTVNANTDRAYSKAHKILRFVQEVKA